MANDVVVYEPGGRRPVSTELKIERVKARAAETQSYLDFAAKAMNNPIIELAAWMLVFDYFENHLPGHGVMKLIEEAGAPVVFTAGVGVITAQALAPTMPLFAQGLGAVGSLVKTVGAVGAAGG